MSQIGIIHMDRKLETKINQYGPRLLTFVCKITLSRDDIRSGSLNFKLVTWRVCGHNLEQIHPDVPRKVWFMSTQHPTTCLMLKRISNFHYVLKNGWSCVVQTENFKVGDEVLLWAFTDVYGDGLYFAMHHLDGDSLESCHAFLENNRIGSPEESSGSNFYS